MNPLVQSISYIILFLFLAQMIRLVSYQLGSDYYTLQQVLRNKRSKRGRKPMVTVVIPAHNEGKTVLKCISSVMENDYPKKYLEIIIVDDGSTDNTYKIVKNFKKKYLVKNLKVLTQKNSGKSHALNNGIKKAKGSLVMCLDADSYLEKDAISKSVLYFRDKNVVATIANVKIIPNTSIIGLIQQFEYLIAFQIKKAQSSYNIEYVIGGVGATYRKKILEKVGYFDSNTLTDDMDLTMKIITEGNKKNRIVYGSDIVTYTQPCHSIKALLIQRFRWKHGRNQTFYKNKMLLFNSDRKYNKLLTWFYLPYLIISEIGSFLMPIMFLYMAFNVVVYQDAMSLLVGFMILLYFMILNILSEDTLSFKEKMLMLLIAPTMYVLFYLLTYVEYVALLKAGSKLRNLKSGLLKETGKWTHVERRGIRAAL